MKKELIALSVLSVIVLSSCTGWANKQNTETPEQKSVEETTNKNTSPNVVEDDMKKEKMMEEEVNDMIKEDMEKTEKEETMVEKKEEKMMKGTYETYSPEKLANAKGDIVLFFHATWCSACRKVDKTLSENTIPDGYTVLKLDYDKSSELKKKYGVQTQTTFVKVDNKGNKIKKWVWLKSVNDLTK